jgi:prevent-host-death family protein
MVKHWQFQAAKNKFCELIDKAVNQGPQVITRPGEQDIVIISKDEYDRLKKPQSSLVDFFQNSPLVGADLDLERDQTPPNCNYLCDGPLYDHK